MPPVAAAVAGSLSSYFAGITLSGLIANAILSFAGNFVLGALSKAIAGKPKQSGNAAFNQERTQLIRQAITARRIVYGTTKLSGALVFAESTSNGANAAKPAKANKMMHFVIAITGHESESIEKIYLNEIQLTLDVNGFATNAPYGKTVTNDVNLTANIANIVVLSGVATCTTHTNHGFQVGDIARITGMDSRVTGSFTITGVTANTFTFNSVSRNATYSGTTSPRSITSVNRITSSIQSYVRVEKFLGGSNQAASSQLINDVGSLWTNNHRLRGVTYIYIRFEHDNDVFPTGVPNPSVLLKGKRVYDPRDGLTKWSDNWALCVRDYLLTAKIATASEIDEDSVITAANISDELVVLAGGGTEKRYTCNGMIETDRKKKDILQEMLTAGAGKIVYTGGKWSIIAGAWQTPAADALTEDDLDGGISTTTRISKRELFNAVKGVHVSAATAYQSTDFPVVTNSTYLAEDNNERNWKDIELPFTTSASMAQRIAKIELEKARQQITTHWPCKLTAMRYKAGDVIPVTYDRYGWNNKPFEIVDWQFAIRNEGESSRLGVNLSLRETASGVYDWNNGEETTFDLSPNTNLPSAFNVLPPGMPSITESLYSTRDGSGAKAKAIVSWSANNISTTTDTYQLEYRNIFDAEWSIVPTTSGTTYEIFDITPGRYDFRVKAINRLGVSSEYTPRVTQEIYGLLALPADITGLSLQAISSIALFRWDVHPDLDVREGGKILIRHNEAMSGVNWANSYTISEAIPGNGNMATTELKAGTYLFRAMDSSGQLSVNATTITSKDATLTEFTTLTTLQEDPLFTGTHTNTLADESVLKLTGAGLIDDVSDFDSLESIDDLGGVIDTGTYYFDAGIDLGTVKRVRIETSIEMLAVNVNDLIDSRTNNIDDWLDFDGTVDGASVDVYVEVRETDDNPSSSPTWSDWKRVSVADYFTRGLEFRAILTSNDPAYNVNVSRLRVAIKEVV
jgi:hypothetical protein